MGRLTEAFAILNKEKVVTDSWIKGNITYLGSDLSKVKSLQKQRIKSNSIAKTKNKK